MLVILNQTLAGVPELCSHGDGRPWTIIMWWWAPLSFVHMVVAPLSFVYTLIGAPGYCNRWRAPLWSVRCEVSGSLWVSAGGVRPWPGGAGCVVSGSNSGHQSLHTHRRRTEPFKHRLSTLRGFLYTAAKAKTKATSPPDGFMENPH